LNNTLNYAKREAVARGAPKCVTADRKLA